MEMSNMTFTALFGLGNQELLLISVSIVLMVLMLWSLVDILSNTTLSHVAKLIWIVVILFFPVFGTLIYLYYGRSQAHLTKKLGK